MLSASRGHQPTGCQVRPSATPASTAMAARSEPTDSRSARPEPTRVPWPNALAPLPLAAGFRGTLLFNRHLPRQICQDSRQGGAVGGHPSTTLGLRYANLPLAGADAGRERIAGLQRGQPARAVGPPTSPRSPDGRSPVARTPAPSDPGPMSTTVAAAKAASVLSRSSGRQCRQASRTMAQPASGVTGASVPKASARRAMHAREGIHRACPGHPQPLLVELSRPAPEGVEGRLDAGHDAELGQGRQVGGRHHLDVLQPVPAGADGGRAKRSAQPGGNHPRPQRRPRRRCSGSRPAARRGYRR